MKKILLLPILIFVLSLYLNGDELEDNKKVCEQGNYRGCNNVGYFYFEGEGGAEKDYGKAVEYFRKACENGIGEGCSNLAKCYKEGKGVDENLIEAVKLKVKACNLDIIDGGGCFGAGYAYESGDGVEQNFSKAKELFEKSCKGGLDVGCTEAADLYTTLYAIEGGEENFMKARAFYKKACDMGSGYACDKYKVVKKTVKQLAKDCNKKYIKEECLYVGRHYEDEKQYARASWYYLLGGNYIHNFTLIQYIPITENISNIAHSYLLIGDLKNAKKYYKYFLKQNFDLDEDFEILSKIYPNKRELISKGKEIWETLQKERKKSNDKAAGIIWKKVFANYSMITELIAQTHDRGFIVIDEESIIKINKDKKIIWNKKWKQIFGKKNVDISIDAAIHIDDDNSFIIVGSIEPKDDYRSYAWIVKLDENGNKVWEKELKKKYSNQISVITLTKEGDILGAGYIHQDDWIVKFDRKGNLIWERKYHYKDSKENSFTSIALANDGGFLLVGSRKKDSKILKLDKYGKKIWDKTFGGKNRDLLFSLIQLTSGEIFAVGYTESKGIGYTNGWIIKLDKNGHKIWDKVYGGKYSDIFRSIIQSSDGNLVLVGETSSKGAGFTDAWAVKIDKNGKKKWDKIFGYEYEDSFRTVIQTSDGNFVASGFTSTDVGKHFTWIIKFAEMDIKDKAKHSFHEILIPFLKKNNLDTVEYREATKKLVKKLIEKYGKEKAEKKIKLLMKIKPTLVIKMINGLKDDLSNNQAENNTTNTNASQENSNTSIDDNNQKADTSSKQENTQLSIEDKIKSFLSDFYTTTQYDDIDYDDIDKVLSFYSDNPKRFFILKNPTKEMIKQKQLKYTQKWPNREYSFSKIELLDDYTKDSKKYYIVKAYIQWKVSSDSKSVKGQSEHLISLVEEDGKFLIDSITAVAINRHSSG